MKQLASTRELLPVEMQQRVELPATVAESTDSNRTNEFFVDVVLTIQVRIQAKWRYPRGP